MVSQLAITTKYPLTLPQIGFLRIWHIVGNAKTNTPALLPIGRTSVSA